MAIATACPIGPIRNYMQAFLGQFLRLAGRLRESGWRHWEDVGDSDGGGTGDSAQVQPLRSGVGGAASTLEEQLGDCQDPSALSAVLTLGSSHIKTIVGLALATTARWMGGHYTGGLSTKSCAGWVHVSRVERGE